MKNKKILLKYIVLSILTLIFILIALFFYSNQLRKKLTSQIETTLSEVAYQNKMIIENRIAEKRKIVNELSIMINNEETLMNEHTLKVIKSIYESNEFNQIGIATAQKTTYISENGFKTLEENYFSEIEVKTSSIKLDEDSINKRILICEPIKAVNGEEGVLFFSYELYHLVDELSAPYFKGMGYAYITDNSGNQILNSNRGEKFSEFNNIYDTMKKMSDYNTDAVTKLEEDMKNRTSGSIEFFNKEDKEMYYMPLDINDWYILTVVPINTINDTYNDIILITYVLSAFIIFVLLVLLYSFIKSNYKKNTKVYNLTYIDKTTGGYSFTKFSEEFMKNREINTNKSLMVLDIDNFKLLNALFGYEKGDVILKDIYNIIVKECESNGFCCRKEADHYLIFYKYSNEKKLLDFIKRIHDKIINYKITESDYVLGPSIGICTFTDSLETIENLENKAITAWKTIKNDNYKYYSFFDDKVLNEMVENKKILDKLIKATNENKLEIYYQPKFDSQTKKVAGAEALLRWKDRGNYISPGKFIPIAEEFGYITKIDEYVIKNVCKDISSLKSENIKVVPVSVNVSRKKLEEKDFVKEYINIIKSYDLEVSDIQLEITEGTILSDEKSIQKSVDDIKEAGIYTLIDDFGTGYSSISSLKNLKIDGIKIDKSFVTDKSEKGIKILTYVVNLAKSLNTETTAEGVETEEQYNTVRNLGCDLIQGYYFSNVISFEEFKKLLKV